MGPGLGGFPFFFMIAFGVVALMILAVVVLVVRSALRSRQVLRDSGLDPLSAHAQIAARIATGPLGTPARTLEQRLTELDDLRRRGLITEAEHGEARRAALSEQS
jgi:heme exporter protein D